MIGFIKKLFGLEKKVIAKPKSVKKSAAKMKKK